MWDYTAEGVKWYFYIAVTYHKHLVGFNNCLSCYFDWTIWWHSPGLLSFVLPGLIPKCNFHPALLMVSEVVCARCRLVATLHYWTGNDVIQGSCYLYALGPLFDPWWKSCMGTQTSHLQVSQTSTWWHVWLSSDWRRKQLCLGKR